MKRLLTLYSSSSGVSTFPSSSNLMNPRRKPFDCLTKHQNTGTVMFSADSKPVFLSPISSKSFSDHTWTNESADKALECQCVRSTRRHPHYIKCLWEQLKLELRLCSTCRFYTAPVGSRQSWSPSRPLCWPPERKQGDKRKIESWIWDKWV